jgi:hypothetical protein
MDPSDLFDGEYNFEEKISKDKNSKLLWLDERSEESENKGTISVIDRMAWLPWRLNWPNRWPSVAVVWKRNCEMTMRVRDLEEEEEEEEEQMSRGKVDSKRNEQRRERILHEQKLVKISFWKSGS